VGRRIFRMGTLSNVDIPRGRQPDGKASAVPVTKGALVNHKSKES
jgi:hypothetical protein